MLLASRENENGADEAARLDDASRGGFGRVAVKLRQPLWSIRYRLTLEVETPEGTKTGSGVIEHAARWNDGLRVVSQGPKLCVAQLAG